MSRKVTQDEFNLIKTKLRFQKPQQVAREVQRHIAIVLKAQASKSYQQYREISKAEHPPIKNSLADRVGELENWRKQEVDPHLSQVQRGRTQMALELNEDSDV